MAGARESGVCQCCFGNNDCVNMLASYLYAGIMENYAEMLMETFAVNVEGSSSDVDADSKPLICRECVPRLRDAHAFRAQLQRTQARLQEQGESKYPIITKVESQEEYDAESHGAASSAVLSQGETVGAHNAAGTSGGAGAWLHASSSHKATQNLFMCDICLKGFKEKYNLVSHLKTHDDQKYCACSNADVSHKSNLKIHLKTHIREKPYTCKDCNASFNLNSSLNKHLRTHTGEKLHICKHCNASFNQNSDLIRHLRTHTGEKPFICKQCNAAFSENGNLKKHLRIHTGEKPFICKHCNAAFNENGNLKKHLRIHTGEKPYVCTLCNVAFSENGNLKKHLKTHTLQTL